MTTPPHPDTVVEVSKTMTQLVNDVIDWNYRHGVLACAVADYPELLMAKKKRMKANDTLLREIARLEAIVREYAVAALDQAIAIVRSDSHLLDTGDEVMPDHEHIRCICLICSQQMVEGQIHKCSPPVPDTEKVKPEPTLRDQLHRLHHLGWELGSHLGHDRRDAAALDMIGRIEDRVAALLQAEREDCAMIAEARMGGMGIHQQRIHRKP